MTTSERAPLYLSEDELIVFLGMVGCSTMNGLDDEPLHGLSKSGIAQRVNSGEHSLLSRGLISRNGDELILDDALVTLVGASLLADAILLLTRLHPATGSSWYYFNAMPQLLVEHSSPRTGIHTFIELKTFQAISDRVDALLGPIHRRIISVDAQPYLVRGADWTQFIEHCQQSNSKTASDVLLQAGYPRAFVYSLTEAYSSSTTWLAEVVWGLQEDEAKGTEAVTVISSKEGAWLVTNPRDKPGCVSIRLANQEECRAEIHTLLHRLREAAWRE